MVAMAGLSRRRPALWQAQLVVGVIALAGYRFLIPDGVYDIAYVGIGVFGILSVLLGVHRWRPASPAPWWLLAMAIAAWIMGDLIYFTLAARSPDGLPFPTIADLSYYLFFPLAGASLFRTVRRRLPGRDRAGLIDATLISVGAAVLSWTFLISPYAADRSLGLLEKLAWIGYPVGDLLLAALLARLLLSPGPRVVTFSLLVAAFGCELASDAAYGYQSIAGTYRPGDLVDLGWLTAYVLIGAAALHPSMDQLTERAPLEASQQSRRRLAVMAVAALAAPALIMVQVARADYSELLVLGGGCVVMFVLVLVRMSGLLDEVEAQRDQLRTTFAELEQAQADRRLLLDRTVRAAEDERTRLAANLHDGPVQRLAAVSLILDRAMLRLDRGDTAVVAELLERGHAEVQNEVGTLRRVMSELRPPVLDEAGFAAGVQDLIDGFARRNRVSGQVRGVLVTPLAPDAETALYRVVQEALSNVGKHAEATAVDVELHDLGDSVELTVADDGRGFRQTPANALLRDGHFGLVGMRERLEAAGGLLTIDSEPGTGTRLTAHVPRQRTAGPDEPAAAAGETA